MTTKTATIIPSHNRRKIADVCTAKDGEIVFETEDFAVVVKEVPADAEQHKWRPFNYAVWCKLTGVIECILDALTIAVQIAQSYQVILDALESGEKVVSMPGKMGIDDETPPRLQ